MRNLGLNKLSKSQQKNFLNEYSYAKGLHGGSQLYYDYSKLENLMSNNSSMPKSDAEMISKVGAEKAMATQKSIVINIARLGGVDRLDIHGSKLNEGIEQWEKLEKEMFLRVVNSALGLANN